MRSDLRGANSLVADLMARRRWLYWLDLCGCLAVVALGLFLGGRSPSWWSLVLMPVLTVALFRAGAFIHEIQHFRPGEFRSFRIVWNLIVGCPMGIPDPMFDYHKAHHSLAVFGTEADAEYMELPRPFPVSGYWEVARGGFMGPVLVNIRFTIGTLSLLFSRDLRDKFERRLSQFHLDPWTPQESWTPELRRRWMPFEVVAFVERVAVLVLVVLGVVPLWALVLLFVCLVGTNSLNRLRFLLQHRYQVRPPRSFEEQVTDSIDYPTPLTFLWSPLGLGYHATHHWFPRMPYHALGRAHRRLADSEAYGAVVRGCSGPTSLRQALADLSRPQSGGTAPVTPA